MNGTGKEFLKKTGQRGEERDWLHFDFDRNLMFCNYCFARGRLEKSCTASWLINSAYGTLYGTWGIETLCLGYNLLDVPTEKEIWDSSRPFPVIANPSLAQSSRNFNVIHACLGQDREAIHCVQPVVQVRIRAVEQWKYQSVNLI